MSKYFGYTQLKDLQLHDMGSDIILAEFFSRAEYMKV